MSNCEGEKSTDWDRAVGVILFITTTIIWINFSPIIISTMIKGLGCFGSSDVSRASAPKVADPSQPKEQPKVLEEKALLLNEEELKKKENSVESLNMEGENVLLPENDSKKTHNEEKLSIEYYMKIVANQPVISNSNKLDSKFDDEKSKDILFPIELIGGNSAVISSKLKKELPHSRFEEFSLIVKDGNVDPSKFSSYICIDETNLKIIDWSDPKIIDAYADMIVSDYARLNIHPERGDIGPKYLQFCHESGAKDWTLKNDDNVEYLIWSHIFICEKEFKKHSINNYNDFKKNPVLLNHNKYEAYSSNFNSVFEPFIYNNDFYHEINCFSLFVN